MKAALYARIFYTFLETRPYQILLILSYSRRSATYKGNMGFWIMITIPGGMMDTQQSPMINDKREIFGWAMYDWANSAFSTTVGTVFLAPYLASLARDAAAKAGTTTVPFFGIPVAPDSFLPYCISLSVGLQVLFLPILGAIADYSHMRKRLMQIFATIGALSTIAMFSITADLWSLGGVLFILANLAFGAAVVFYN